ncbi:bifunctional adenosylcobinamide kinase/adenosylcobinamide-phosphate guanylyltransferase [Pelagovum pacificum]|uniref:Bifunctional adenosylcobalamin biosynthesis protein n=1 Tax=Pelagovum pacificum TaxID=2588711 RepID=A0A5C5G9I2_9RHOB|nr:bifunctional adenosylcobinamide kinase/adenosylcobinamide-phosphate guanylyltransferase [Pelagovum pacificum]QQA42145.1 bifunctional adenosylcobinamide kinase/adenosylcobinamide-phosphate guanylyltransferase [Pelagovum pacificum]TNY31233.1 bifunctional adenosylcobinamide kinase/adenosylcobinamide-phosphate guanylyltransferase [Pelagovum pacificum]
MLNLTLVLGGAASGKSSHAEMLVRESGRSRVYLATAQAFDTEMKQKIEEHRLARGDGWTTVEEPLEIAPALASVDAEKIILLDCATLWLGNYQLAGNDPAEAPEVFAEALGHARAPVVVVSNEVGQGIVPADAMSRAFRNAQGRLNQRVAAMADRVVFVTAGLPQVLK